jgi:phospho-N-acetylmuramoyl-pentapeptide-transferase
MEASGLMIDFLFLFLSGLVSFVLYPIWINFVYKFQMGEEIRGDGPKSHLEKRGTPTMGGLVFIVTTTLITLIFNRSRTQTIFPAFIASLAGLLGLLDDFTKVYKKSGLPGFFSGIKLPVLNKIFSPFIEFWRIVGSSESNGIQTYQKFIVQGLIGGFASYWTYFKLGWNYIWFPWIGNVHVGLLYPLIVFVLFIVVFNAVAFTDGLDGLAGGLALICLVSFWVISRALGYNSLSIYCATFVGALIPFLYFNIYPARIFMGNVGSHVLGAVLAILAVVMHRELAFLILGGVFLVDGISSPLQQLSVKLTRKRLFRMAPIHHHFELLGWPETKVTLRFWIFGIFLAFAGMFIALL